MNLCPAHYGPVPLTHILMELMCGRSRWVCFVPEGMSWAVKSSVHDVREYDPERIPDLVARIDPLREMEVNVMVLGQSITWGAPPRRILRVFMDTPSGLPGTTRFLVLEPVR